jgi:hypothetical protein
MKAKLQLQRSVYEEQIRTALHAHWHASAAGDTDVEPASQNSYHPDCELRTHPIPKSEEG